MDSLRPHLSAFRGRALPSRATGEILSETLATCALCGATETTRALRLVRLDPWGEKQLLCADRDACHSDFWESHAVAPEIRAGRYRRWEDDPAPVREACAGLTYEQRRFMEFLAEQSPGWIIYRHAPPGLPAAPVCPEIRPDRPVTTQRKRHFHYHGPIAKGQTLKDLPLFTPSGRPLPDQNRHSVRAMAAHIRKAKESRPITRDGDIWAYVDHGGTNCEHVHGHKNYAKYVFPRKDGWNDLARRLDLHPLAVPLLKTAERVFFAIEGCIKADSILSQGEAVFSVPSVTLWRAKELGDFAKCYLGGKLVFIVPDADWFSNQMVITQALFCRSYFRDKLGVNAHIAAPPMAAKQKGVDDFLANGGSVGKLEVIDWQVPPDNTFLDWLKQYGRDIDPYADAPILRAIALHANDQGQLKTMLNTLALAVNTSPANVIPTILSLVSCGAIEIEGGALSVDRWVYHGRYRDPNLGWVDPPTLTVSPELRRKRLPSKTVANITADPPQLVTTGFYGRPLGQAARITRQKAAGKTYSKTGSIADVAKEIGRSERTGRRYLENLPAKQIEARRETALSFKRAGFSKRKIARYLGMSVAAVSKMLERPPKDPSPIAPGSRRRYKTSEPRETQDGQLVRPLKDIQLVEYGPEGEKIIPVKKPG